MTRRDAVCAAVLHHSPFGQRAEKGHRQHSFCPIAHCPIGEELGARVRRHSWFAVRWMTFASESQVSWINAFCAKVLNDVRQRVLESRKVRLGSAHRFFSSKSDLMGTRNALATRANVATVTFTSPASIF